LEGVVVQGEIDVIRRAEEMDRTRREMESVAASGVRVQLENVVGINGSAGAVAEAPAGATTTTTTTIPSRHRKRLSGLTQSEVDAMKPVGEVELEEDEEEEDDTAVDNQGRPPPPPPHHQPPLLASAPAPAR
jgi:serine/threonine-protein kinase SRPK3